MILIPESSNSLYIKMFYDDLVFLLCQMETVVNTDQITLGVLIYQVVSDLFTNSFPILNSTFAFKKSKIAWNLTYLAFPPI